MQKLITLSLTLIVACFLFTLFVFAGEEIRYDFDEVEVIYAAEFNANPVNVQEGNWLAELAGGTEKPIQQFPTDVIFKRYKFLLT